MFFACLSCGGARPKSGSTVERASSGQPRPTDRPARKAQGAERVCATIAWSTLLDWPKPLHAAEAVVLLDGRVLIVGASTWLLDTTVPELRELAAPKDHRLYGHTLTRLADGRVLLVGGSSSISQGSYSHGSTVLEMFDPKSERWVELQAPPPMAGRVYHTTTLLADGRLLIAGGYASGGRLARQEATTFLYDPGSNRWLPGPTMKQKRENHTATRVANGRVVVIGGQFYDDGNHPAAEVEVFDAATLSFNTMHPSPVPRSQHRAVHLKGGHILLVGGWAGDYGRARIVDRYEPAEDRWIEAAELSVGRGDVSATRFDNGQVLVVGGETNGNLMNGSQFADLYDPDADRWLTATPPATGRFGHAAVAIGPRRVLLIGGYKNQYESAVAPLEIGDLKGAGPCAR